MRKNILVWLNKIICFLGWHDWSCITTQINGPKKQCNNCHKYKF